MSKGGFPPERLKRIRPVLSGYIDRGEVAGVVALVCRHGEVHVEALGAKTIDNPAPMKRDSIANGTPITEITPVWRVLDPKAPTLKKLSYDPAFIIEQRTREALA